MRQSEQGNGQTTQLWEAARAEEPGLKTELLKKIAAEAESRSPSYLAAQLCLRAEDSNAKGVSIVRKIILYEREAVSAQEEFAAGQQRKQKLERRYKKEFEDKPSLYSCLDPFYNDPQNRQAFVTLGQAGLETIIGRFAATKDPDDIIIRTITFEALLALDKLAHTITYMDNPPAIVTEAMAVMEAEMAPENKKEMKVLLLFHLGCLDSMYEQGSLSGYTK